jgi:transposase
MKALEGQFMEVFTPPPYREARPHGRPAKLTPEARLAVANSVMSKEMTYREAAKAYGISPGAVGSCVRLYKKDGAKSKVNARIKAYNKASDEYRHQAQVKELKQEIADLYLQVQILKKILNKSLLVKKSNGSVITTDNLDQLQKDVE